MAAGHISRELPNSRHLPRHGHLALLCWDFPREGTDLRVATSGARPSRPRPPANAVRNKAQSLWVFWSIKSKSLLGYNFGFESQSLDCVRGFSGLRVNEDPPSAPASLQREATEEMMAQVGRVCGRFSSCLLDARGILAEEKGIQAALWVRGSEVGSPEVIPVQELTEMGERNGDPTGLRAESHGRSNRETQGALTMQYGGPGTQ